MYGNVSQYRSSNGSPRATSGADQGMILVMVLMLLGLITALVIQAQVAARMMLRAEERQSLQVQLRAAALDAAWGALRLLADDADLQVDHTNEPWAEPLDQLLPNGIETTVQIVDENRFFDINNLWRLERHVSARVSGKTMRIPLDIVRDLLASSRRPDPSDQAQALKDWIDPDHEGLREASYYQGLNPPVDIADALMESPQELAGVLALPRMGGDVPQGFTVLPDRSTRIVPINGALSAINLNTADRTVIAAVLGRQDAHRVDDLCRFRDAGPLSSLLPLNRLINAGGQNAWAPYVDVKSSFFSVIACATKEGRSEQMYGLVYRDPQGHIDILRWVRR